MSWARTSSPRGLKTGARQIRHHQFIRAASLARHLVPDRPQHHRGEQHRIAHLVAGAVFHPVALQDTEAPEIERTVQLGESREIVEGGPPDEPQAGRPGR